MAGKELVFERTYEAPVETVWQAWTDPEMLAKWWGPKDVTVPECEMDICAGGRIYIVMEAGEGMGSYKGTRWPLEGTFTTVEKPSRLSYDAKSWTEGKEKGLVVKQQAELVLTAEGNKTSMKLVVTVFNSGLKAKLAIWGIKSSYKEHFNKLGELLELAVKS